MPIKPEPSRLRVAGSGVVVVVVVGGGDVEKVNAILSVRALVTDPVCTTTPVNPAAPKKKPMSEAVTEKLFRYGLVLGLVILAEADMEALPLRESEI